MKATFLGYSLSRFGICLCLAAQLSCVLAPRTQAEGSQEAAPAGRTSSNSPGKTKNRQDKSSAAPAAAAESAGPDKVLGADEKSEKIDPHSPYKEEAVQHYNRGHDLHQGGFFNQAIAEYKAALTADDRMEEAYTNLGLIYAAQRNYTKAMDAFKKALVLKPGRPNALNGLGTVLYAKNRMPEAMEKWKQATEADPHFASAYYNMGNALENEKDLCGAVDAYVKAMEINPLMADAYYRVGSIFARQKHVAQASILLVKAVELDPTAEFVRDARKTLTSFEGDLTRDEADEPEVKMNIIAPPPDASGNQSSSGPADKSSFAAGSSSFADPAQTKAAVERDKW